MCDTIKRGKKRAHTHRHTHTVLLDWLACPLLLHIHTRTRANAHKRRAPDLKTWTLIMEKRNYRGYDFINVSRVQCVYLHCINVRRQRNNTRLLKRVVKLFVFTPEKNRWQQRHAFLYIDVERIVIAAMATGPDCTRVHTVNGILANIS